MKSQKDIQERLNQLDEKMAELMPNEKDISELREWVESGCKASSDEMIVKIYRRQIDVFSIDAQRFILQWILND